jgi:hypothetical protein
MSHLAPDEIVDAIDGTLSAPRRAHLDGCDRCRAVFTEVAAMLGEARAVDVPDPSPLFWEHFANRVRASVAAETAPPSHRERWFHWPVLAPLGLMALLVLTLASLVARDANVASRTQTAVNVANGAADQDFDAEWRTMTELMGELDIDAAMEAGFTVRPGAADAAVVQLSAVEQEELARLLHEELAWPR